MPFRLLAVNALIRVSAAASGQLFAYLLADRMGNQVGSGALLVGVLGAAFFATELVGAPFAGRLADRIGQLRVLRWGPLFGIASALVAAGGALGIPSLALLGGVLFVARLAEGSSAALAVPTTLVLLARATEGNAERRMRIMAAFEVTSLVGMIAGYVLVGFSWDVFGEVTFLFLPVFYGLAFALVPPARSEPAPTGALRPVGKALRALAAQPGAVGFAVAWLAVNAVVGLWIQQAPFLFSLPERSATQALVGGFTGRDVGLIFGAWGGTFLLGITLWSLLAPTWPRRRALRLALFGMIGVTVCLALANRGAAWPVLAAAAFFVLIEAGFTPAAFAHLADLSEPLDDARGLVLGLYALTLSAGQLAGNLVGAPLAARWQMDGVLALTVLLALVGLIGVAQMPDGARSEQ